MDAQPSTSSRRRNEETLSPRKKRKRLPPYHCELNPIELVWAQVKGHVAKNNKTFKMNEVRSLFEERLRQVTPQRWKDCVVHVIKIEDQMCHLGHITDDITDRFILEVGGDSDDSEYSSDMESLYKTKLFMLTFVNPMKNSGVCDYGGHCMTLAKTIKETTPTAEVICKRGRQGSFEIQVNEKKVYSKLQTMALPDYKEVADVVSDVSYGSEPREIKGEQPINCVIS